MTLEDKTKYETSWMLVGMCIIVFSEGLPEPRVIVDN